MHCIGTCTQRRTYSWTYTCTQTNRWDADTTSCIRVCGKQSYVRCNEPTTICWLNALESSLYRVYSTFFCIFLNETWASNFLFNFLKQKTKSSRTSRLDLEFLASVKKTFFIWTFDLVYILRINLWDRSNFRTFRTSNL